VSALHGRGAGDVLDRVVSLFPPPAEDEVVAEGDEEEGERIFGVAIVGRPNVGKSTLFNRLIGDERAVVHDMPGTTRDTIDTIVETEHGPIRFIDTAGMRRRSRIDEGTEYYSMVRALQAVDRADVALLVIDATEGVTAQDQRLAERIDAAGCPIVVLLNKWDLVETEERTSVLAQVGRKLHFAGDAVVLKISARSGKGVHRLLPALAEAIDAYHTRVPTRRVNEVIRQAQAAQPAPHGARVLYATQGAPDPPTFTLFANKELPPTYLRYLERKLREAFDLGATPIKLRVRRRTDSPSPRRSKRAGGHGTTGSARKTANCQTAAHAAERRALRVLRRRQAAPPVRVRVLVRARTGTEPARRPRGHRPRPAHDHPVVQGATARHHLRRRPGQPELQRAQVPTVLELPEPGRGVDRRPLPQLRRVRARVRRHFPHAAVREPARDAQELLRVLPRADRSRREQRRRDAPHVRARPHQHDAVGLEQQRHRPPVRLDELRRGRATRRALRTHRESPRGAPHDRA